MSRLVHLSLWPWKRTTARSAVAASTGGMELECPSGMSRLTYGTAYDRRKSSVAGWLSGRTQVALRTSTQIGSASWMSPDNQPETLDFLRSYAVPYVSLDMPEGHPSSIPPVLAATADLAVVRFHGHSDKWTSRDIYERFGYRYSEQELAEWAPRVRALAEQAGETHVLMNNCYRDYAQTNARQLADLLAD